MSLLMADRKGVEKSEISQFKVNIDTEFAEEIRQYLRGVGLSDTEGFRRLWRGFLDQDEAFQLLFLGILRGRLRDDAIKTFKEKTVFTTTPTEPAADDSTPKSSRTSRSGKAIQTDLRRHPKNE